jgi:hypothetical protein
MQRIGIRALMSVIVGLAVAFAALRNADDYRSGGLLIVLFSFNAVPRSGHETNDAWLLPFAIS